ncbi:cell division control protein 48 homolog C [Cajanus cajan]|uniref:Cell division control protein 48 isogeny C n=1 Tax=Cajanus cajan TaxID=3821 RepID=A0A151SY17_CAJCA|nr:cell division control protein 48 homolog C [Cajanus cajan]KYP59682.1 Cell division control protein 48 isogeny C [Cajanus cajan]
MGRRRNGQETLRRRVESLYPSSDQTTHRTTDQIVQRLRSTYPDYRRIKHHALFRLVHEALLPSHGNDDEQLLQPSRKRRSTSSESDADNGTPSELSFDLTKTMLRNTYLGMQEKNVGSVNETETTLKSSRKRLKGDGDDEKVKGIGFSDLGGIKKIRKELDVLLLPFYQPQVARDLGMSPTSGILLHGPPGCGKTRLAHAIAHQTGFPFYQISPAQVVSGISGESEQNIRDIFSKAHRTAPSIIFIDEIDAIASKREDLSREMEKRIVTQLLTSMDQPDNNSNVLVIGATNRPNVIDSALRRPGRFDREIYIGMPDESAREEILSVLTRNVKLQGPIDLLKIAKSTSAFVASDLKSVISHAGSLAMKRIIYERYTTAEPPEDCFSEPWSPEEVDKAAITMSDLEEAVKMVQSSERREGFNPIPDVKWEDVGGLDLLRNEFDDYIIGPIKCPGDYEGFGLDLSTGFLLYGPPGCDKPLVAKAVANAAGVSFRHIKGPDILNEYVGVSENNVRKIFDAARTCAPCILFFDELDALTTTRGKGKEGASVTDRVLNQLLIELDGAEHRKNVFVIGATNRPEVIDPALLRPGRLGRLVYVPLPSPDQRVLILKTLARKYPIDDSTDLSAIGRSEACENMSGADLALLMEEAVMTVVRKNRTSNHGKEMTIKPWHIEEALTRVFPSVSDKQKQYYQRLSERFSPSFHRNVRE